MARAYAELAVLNKASLQAAQPYLSALRAADITAMEFSRRLRLLDRGIDAFCRVGNRQPHLFLKHYSSHLGLHAQSPVTYHPGWSPTRTAGLRMETYVVHLVRELSRRYSDKTEGVRTAEEAIQRVLKKLESHWPATNRTSLLDNDRLFLCFCAVVFRDWLYESFTFDDHVPHEGLPPSSLLLDLSTGPALLPTHEWALLLIDDAVRRLHLCDFKGDDPMAFASDLNELVGRHPELWPQLLSLQEMIGFLTGEPASRQLLDSLIAHLLRADAHWGAADITLLLHLATLSAIDGSALDREHIDIGTLDPGSEIHVDAMNRLARFQRKHAELGVALLPAQIENIKCALVNFMKHLCSLVPEHQPAGAWKHLELVPQPLLISAVLCLNTSEQVKFVASCPEWPDLSAVFRQLPIPLSERRKIYQHFTSTWPNLLSLILFSQLGRWRDWMDSFGHTAATRLIEDA